MKIKTSELIGRPLDYAVAIALVGTYLQFDTVGTWRITIDGRDRALSRGWSAAQNFSPSTDWAEGGPIIEREIIELLPMFNPKYWSARVATKSDWVDGPTPLIAAMRCYVASKLGGEVEVPDELLREL